MSELDPEIESLFNELVAKLPTELPIKPKPVLTEQEVLQSSESQDKQHKLQLKQLARENIEQGIIWRNILSVMVFAIIIIWMVGVYVILFLSGVRLFSIFGFYWPSEVLITLLGTTTATVLGLAYIVVQHFFPKGHNHELVNILDKSQDSE